MAQGDLDGAEADYGVAITFAYSDPWALLGRSRVRTARERLSEALEDANEADRRAPRRSEILLERGLIYMGLGSRKPAEEDLREAAELAPERSAPLVGLAGVAESWRDFAAAIRYLEKALTLAPARFDVRRRLARLYRAERSVEKAVGILRSAPADSPWESADLLLFARCLFETDRFDESAATFTRARERGAPTDETLRERAEALDRAGRPHEALRDIEALLKESPNTLPLRVRRAQLYEKVGRDAEALDEWTLVNAHPLASPSEKQMASEAVDRLRSRLPRK